MTDVTTTQLFSIDTFKPLVVEPLFRESKVLSSGLTRLDTDSTRSYLPVVTGGAATRRDELEDLGDAGILASELEVTPRKLAVAQIVSSEATDDAQAAVILGSAMVTAAVDAAFFQGGAKARPV